MDRLPADGDLASLMLDRTQVHAHWATSHRLRRALLIEVGFGHPSVGRDGQMRSPFAGRRETRRAAVAGRNRRTTGRRAKACQQERLSMSDPHDLRLG